jgi:hypothetical protein
MDLRFLRENIRAFFVGSKRKNTEVLFKGMLPNGTAVFDLEVEEDHSFCINGLFAHNTNCKCRWEIVPVDKKKGDYDAYWRMSDAEHCQTCIERAQRWNPLRIRGLQLELPNVKETRLKEIMGEVSRIFDRISHKHLQGQHDQERHGWRYGKNARMSSPENQAEYETWLKRSEGRAINQAALGTARRKISGAREKLADAFETYSGRESHDGRKERLAFIVKNQSLMNEITILDQDIKDVTSRIEYRKEIIRVAEAGGEGSPEWRDLAGNRTRQENDEYWLQLKKEERAKVEEQRAEVSKQLEAANSKLKDAEATLRRTAEDYANTDVSFAVSEGMREGSVVRKRILNADKVALRRLEKIQNDIMTAQQSAEDYAYDKASRVDLLNDPALRVEIESEIYQLHKKQQYQIKRLAVLKDELSSITSAQIEEAHKLLFQNNPEGVKPNFTGLDVKDDYERSWREGFDVANHLAGYGSTKLVPDPELNTTLDIRSYCKPPERDITFRKSSPGGLNLYYVELVNASIGADKGAVIHELGHHIEHHDRLIARATHEFLVRRTKKETPKKLAELLPGRNFSNDEVSKPDKFYDPYMGKIYNDMSSEILSMGMELFYENPVRFARLDPQTFDFVYAVLRLGGKV